ncbi:phage protein NinX family protein [Morganella morganii]|uniref:phage protein NinX family protein n=1 Tax=Morganella morganii TaxID=582 RepID=UPI003EB70160
MNRYRDKSDFEINKAVAIANGHKVMSCEESVMAYIDSGYKPFDPCNNPADAWSIILKNRISIIIPGNEYSDGYSTPFAASGFDDVSHITRNTYYTDEESFNQNPLRAAMEVFLMMKDAENES